jgi:hypothetical protein
MGREAREADRAAFGRCHGDDRRNAGTMPARLADQARQKRTARRRPADRRDDRASELDVLLFFPDPLEAQPHDVDVKALLRLVLVYDIPAAFSPRTATALAHSGLFD